MRADLGAQDSKGYAHTYYTVDGSAIGKVLFVVRPDEVVGAVLHRGAAGVEQYFHALLADKSVSSTRLVVAPRQLNRPLLNATGYESHHGAEPDLNYMTCSTH